MFQALLQKLHAYLVAVVMLVCFVSAMPMHTYAMVWGDCNGDGSLTVADAHCLAAALCGVDGALWSRDDVYADCNGDGLVNALDLTTLKRAIFAGTGAESATLLIYQCGSDLESEASEATTDFHEMLEGVTNGNLQIVMETGGAKTWHNSYSNADANYCIAFNGTHFESQAIGDAPRNMGQAETLTQFITESVAAYPADRYALVIWDHGGGPIYGSCFDELFDDVLYMPELCNALDASGVHFDWIGFDCCLMGAAEVAYALRDFADYMVASEESESGYGWYYTNFLTAWSENLAMPTEELVGRIVHDMVNYNRKRGAAATLAAYDLSKAAPLMESVYALIDDTTQLAQEGGIRKIMMMRAMAVDFGKGEYDLVDLGDFASKLKTLHTQDVQDAIAEMVVSFESSRVRNVTGVSIWFFENYPEDYVYLPKFYLALGIDEVYVTQLQTLAMAQIAAQTTSTNDISPIRKDAMILAMH